MRIERQQAQLWAEFGVVIENDLCFEAGGRYQLCGNNGSGKSSFLRKLLLPALLKEAGNYVLYFEQQMNLQLFTIRAHAAMNPSNPLLATEFQAVEFLLDDLRRTLDREPRPHYLILDETHETGKIIDHVVRNLPDSCMIIASHVYQLPQAQRLVFEEISPSESRLYVATD
jgi:ATPase subunit of ABC transporter with duplicated ATPase domains